MRRRLSLGLLCLTLAACARQADIIVTGGMVWTGLSNGAPQKGAVALANGKIRTVADSADLAIGEGNRALLGCAVREAGPDHPTGDDDVSLPGAGGEGQAEESQRQASAHAVPSAQLRDAVDGFERGDRVGSRGLPGPRLGSRREGREGIADVEQHLEQQLLALVGGVEVRHADLVAGGLRAVVGLAVDGLEIAEDAIAGAWHGQRI